MGQNDHERADKQDLLDQVSISFPALKFQLWNDGGFLAGAVVQLSTDQEVFEMGFGWLAGGIKGAGGAWGLPQQVPAQQWWCGLFPPSSHFKPLDH